MPTDDTETIIAWKPKRLSHESVKILITLSNSISPKLKWIHNSKEQ